ncbi:hypothetical protein QTP88_022592 [Uroleucon formosanum]
MFFLQLLPRGSPIFFHVLERSDGKNCLGLAVLVLVLLQDQDQDQDYELLCKIKTKTEPARPRPKQDPHCKSLAAVLQYLLQFFLKIFPQNTSFSVVLTCRFDPKYHIAAQSSLTSDLIE